MINRGLNRRRFRSESGQVLLFAVLAMTVVLAIGVIVVDVGLAISEKDRLQTAADAASLAGARVLAMGGTKTAAEAAACQTYKANGFDSCPTVNIPPDNGAHQGDPAFVEVIGEITTPASFLNIFISESAFAPSSRSVSKFSAGTSTSSPCGFCMLSTTGVALSVQGNGAVTVNTAIAVNSSNTNNAVSVAGNGSVIASAINVVGGVQMQGSNPVVSPTPTTGATPIVDPLAGAGVPSVSGPNFGNVVANSSTTLNPGIYTKLEIGGGSTVVTMNPGVYVIRGTSGLTMASKARLVGSGVTLYFACPAYPAPCNNGGQQGAKFSMEGQAQFLLAAPTTGAWKGMLIYFDRNNNSGIGIAGNSVIEVTGTIYAKSAHLSAQGNGVMDFDSLIVVKSAGFAGNGQVNYDPLNNFPAAGGAGTNGGVNLVE